uniref:Uncharacterized protein ycf45 n=1 Tax=Cyanidium caldarium TaxID=2771 RepID=YCF45_CYACA|nr:hypothetical protein JXY51_pgp129 [Cyanidium caldarium]O19920.1 RecName: Full=Uncharacterized protein ycf45 [Cyanidium caldarium]AAB82669.1 unknown [Cyanidium caldarium]WDB00219.1 hypothetical protein CDCA019_097 [Cyanidium caldarium]
MLIFNDLRHFLPVVPRFVYKSLKKHPRKFGLTEIVLDNGRRAEGRWREKTENLTHKKITKKHLLRCIKKIGIFNEDNRAGIYQTLHRISCIKNRYGNIVGLTYRIGREFIGIGPIIRDLIESNQSTLLIGRPGIGKTSFIREISRILSNEIMKRVIIVDSANEISGEGCCPHISTGKARRMEVQSINSQHEVMIEAIENHTPEIIIIDEIGTEYESQAAISISQRGIRLIGSAHSSDLFNLAKNPTLCKLVGGIESVTLSDTQAILRKTKKTILERKGCSCFNATIEINKKRTVKVYTSVEQSIDAILEGRVNNSQIRSMKLNGEITISLNYQDE